mgnify:CR=1 FL=1
MAAEPKVNGLTWRVVGGRTHLFQDVYPRLMAAPWTVTIALAFAAYVGVALLFAGLFALEPSGVSGATNTSDLMWFSVQTLSTIGYGGMTPESPLANALVIVESFIGLAGVAVVTAILYAKFSLPQPRVRFSEALAVHDRKGQPTLHVRMVNERPTHILDAHLHIGVLVDESEDGHRFRRFVDLELARSRIPMFGMAFTAMHALDESSPLAGLAPDDERLLFLLVTVRGVDGRTLQPVFARQVFTAEHVRFGQGFGNMVIPSDDGVSTLDLGELDTLVPRTLTRTERP